MKTHDVTDVKPVVSPTHKPTQVPRRRESDLPSLPKKEWMKMARDVQRLLDCRPSGRALFMPAVMRCRADGRVDNWMEIARAAKVSRSSLTRALNAWKAQGLAYTDGRGFVGGGFNLDVFVALYKTVCTQDAQIGHSECSNWASLPTYNKSLKRTKSENAPRSFSQTDRDEEILKITMSCNLEVV